MNVIQSYVQGAKHKAVEKPCQDRTGYLHQNGVWAIALADGAGNPRYTHSEIGAEVVVDTITKFFCDNFDLFYEKKDESELGKVVLTVCRRALTGKAEELGLDSISRLSSTLLAVAVKEDKMVYCHIGDGVIGKNTPNGSAVISAPDNGEYANSTFFVTTRGAEDRMRIGKAVLDDETAFFLMSDGTSEYIYDEDHSAFYPAAAKMATLAAYRNGEKQLEEIIKEHMVNSDLTSDDCSFICLSFAQETGTVIRDKKKSPYEYAAKGVKTSVGAKTNSKKCDEPVSVKEIEDVPDIKEEPEKHSVAISALVLILLIAILGTVFFVYKKMDKKGPVTSEGTVSGNDVSENDVSGNNILQKWWNEVTSDKE